MDQQRRRDTCTPSRRQVLAATGTALLASTTGQVVGQPSGYGVSSQSSSGATSPSLASLREKWFLSFDDSDPPFPPSNRHRKSTIKPYVSATVEPLYDGATFMERWYDIVTDMADSSPGESAFYHLTWHLGEVPLLGAKRPDTNAIDVINDAADAGVDVHITISGNQGTVIDDTLTSWEFNLDTVAIDTRYPEAGSMHAKTTVFDSPGRAEAIVGSADLYADRWGRRPYEPDDPNRPADQDQPNHDVSVWLSGPIARELQKIYVNQWNDESRDNWYGDLGRLWTPPKIDPDPIETDEGGDQQVQILRTYARNSRTGYSWSDEGEFTVWAVYIKALKQAEQYVHIEDQFFLPSGSPPWFEESGTKREASLFYWMAQALRRGVDISVVTSNEVSYGTLERQRNAGIEYLRRVGANAPGDFEVGYLHNGVEEVYTHAKLMLVDDEVTYIGAANINRRSMAHDTELHLAIIDAKNEFTQNMRMELCRGHLGLSEREAEATLTDPTTGVPTVIEGIRNGQGLLKRLTVSEAGLKWYETEFYDYVVDPYAGPDHGDITVVADTCLATADPERVDEREATLAGDVRHCFPTELHGHDRVTFTYRPEGSVEWQYTDSRRVTGSGRVEETVDGLSPGTTYEYQIMRPEQSMVPALVDHGDLATFETDGGSFSIPGFTLPATAAGIAGGSYLYRRMADEDEEK